MNTRFSMAVEQRDSHVHVQLWGDGALLGTLTLREGEEFEDFKRLFYPDERLDIMVRTDERNHIVAIGHWDADRPVWDPKCSYRVPPGTVVTIRQPSVEAVEAFRKSLLEMP
jgi:hypothetical protein